MIGILLNFAVGYNYTLDQARRCRLPNVVLLHAKRTRFGVQKDSFCRVKGLVLKCKRTPFVNTVCEKGNVE